MQTNTQEPETTQTENTAKIVVQSEDITKTFSVYAVKTETHSVIYPTKARANYDKSTLDKFGVECVVEAIKKTVTI
jgi:hypothetical protein